MKKNTKNKCCICKEEDKTTPYKKVGSYQLNICKRCSLVFLDHLPRTELNTFIQETKNNDNQNSGEGLEFWSFPNFYSKYEHVFEHFFNQRFNRIQKFNLPEGPFLDVGMGYGFWLNFLTKKGLEVEGIDFSKEAFSYAKDELSLPVQNTSFEDFETEKKFSAIFMFDVLEHFENPDLMLDKAYKMLLPEGIIYIQVPNVLGLKIPYSHGLGLPYHIWQFNPRSLKRLLNKSHFDKNQEYWTGIQGVIGEYEKGGPSLITTLKWNMANFLKIGNRVQMIGQKG